MGWSNLPGEGGCFRTAGGREEEEGPRWIPVVEAGGGGAKKSILFFCVILVPYAKKQKSFYFFCVFLVPYFLPCRPPPPSLHRPPGRGPKSRALSLEGCIP